MNNKATFGMASNDPEQPKSGANELMHLVSLGTATYLSYWTLFFALQRAYTGRKKKS